MCGAVLFGLYWEAFSCLSCYRRLCFFLFCTKISTELMPRNLLYTPCRLMLAITLSTKVRCSCPPFESPSPSPRHTPNQWTYFPFYFMWSSGSRTLSMNFTLVVFAWYRLYCSSQLGSLLFVQESYMALSFFPTFSVLFYYLLHPVKISSSPGVELFCVTPRSALIVAYRASEVAQAEVDDM